VGGIKSQGREKREREERENRERGAIRGDDPNQTLLNE
jgi:hypothetical protein